MIKKQNTIDLNTVKEGSECICILHIKGLKFLKQHYYLDVYVSQIKVFLEGNLKYNILEKYSFNDVEEEELELKELERDLMLDEDYLNSLKNNENEKKEILSEIEKYKNEILNYQTKINELQGKLDNFMGY